ncbi:MAG: 1-(5-phosphoribosyl)-5-[(5-phosphoribosylamino)methylideneamino]imidazole-4-carboxamide isomerase [Planctomycetota bacterium]|jgi:phosphoribosylformimino-5-aminoimidazole carboxamide ribotide isomerase
MDIIPAIDLLGMTVVRLREGEFDSKTEYSHAPADVAQRMVSAGVRWIHVVDLDAAQTGKPTNFAEVLSIRRITNTAGAKIELGGGARDTKTIEHMLANLADRVVVGSAAINNWVWFQGLLEDSAFPNERLALGLDARQGRVAVEGWTKQLEELAVDFAGRVSGSRLGAVIYTDIARDGMLTGPNLEATAEVIAATDVPVIASGGMASLDDIGRCKDIGCGGVILGRAYYEGQIDLREALKISQQ